MYLMETMQSKRQKRSENNWYLGILAFGKGGGVCLDKVQRMMYTFIYYWWA